MAFNKNNFARQSVALNTGGVTLDDASIVGAPAWFTYRSASDSAATIAGANYFAPASAIYDLAVNDFLTCVGSDAVTMLVVATIDRAAGTITTVSASLTGAVATANIEDLAVTTAKIDDLAVTTGKLADDAVTEAKLENPLLADSGFRVLGTTASATPGTIRTLFGDANGTNAVMTSGNLVGVRGSVTYVGASGGFLYGVQGKLITTGTISGSSWNAGVFGQLDISAATVNAGQMATIWGDYGTSSGTMTDTTGLRGIAMTNTTAAVLFAQDYRYGNATNLLELAGAGGTLNYFVDAGTGANSSGNTTYAGADKVLTISVNGVSYYIPLFASNAS